MSEAQLMHATKMAQGEEQYQGKLLEARQSDWKDEAVLIILSLPVVVLAWAVISDDPTAMDKVKLFFEMFSAASIMVYKFMDPCSCEYIWYKGNTNIPKWRKKIMSKKSRRRNRRLLTALAALGGAAMLAGRGRKDATVSTPTTIMDSMPKGIDKVISDVPVSTPTTIQDSMPRVGMNDG